MSRARDIKIRGRSDFEEDFDEIKDLISAKTLITVDEHINKLEDVKKKVSERRDLLRQKATYEKLIDDKRKICRSNNKGFCKIKNVCVYYHSDNIFATNF